MTINGKTVSELIAEAKKTGKTVFGNLEQAYTNFSTKNSINMQMKEFQLPVFNKLDVSLAFNVNFVKSNESKVILELSEDIFDKLNVEVRSDTLIIGLRQGIYNLSTKGENIATIYSNMSLFDLQATGACNITFPDSITSKLTSISLSGSCTCTIGVIDTKKVDVDVSGASNLNIKSGIIETLNIDCSGASSISAYQQDLKVENVDVNCSGAAIAKVRATNNAKLDASGASEIHLYGHTKQVSKDRSGASSISIF